jgi:hypothetical protein
MKGFPRNILLRNFSITFVRHLNEKIFKKDFVKFFLQSVKWFDERM